MPPVGLSNWSKGEQLESHFRAHVVPGRLVRPERKDSLASLAHPIVFQFQFDGVVRAHEAEAGRFGRFELQA